MTQPLRYFVVDAFADRPFSGNPAAVVPLEAWPADRFLQSLAMEMNLSETAYCVPRADRPRSFDLRWFTPKVEVDLCGHATLATARVLLELGLAAEGDEIQFHTRSGILSARVGGNRIVLDFPVKAEQPAEPPAGLCDALGLEPRYVGKNQFDYLVEAATEDEVRRLAPNFGRLAAVPCRGVIVTAASTGGDFDFVSRFFAPAAGVDEDPVTGSARCCLADFWRKKTGKSRFNAWQASARGGRIEVELVGNRVLLGGAGVLVAQGVLHVDPSAD
jgi:PhzF family phenazine biosynthesis protein